MTTEEKLIAIIENDPAALKRALSILQKARATEVQIVEAQVVQPDEQPAVTVARLRQQLTTLQGVVEGLKRDWAQVVSETQAREHRNLNRLDAYMNRVREVASCAILLINSPETASGKECDEVTKMLREL